LITVANYQLYTFLNSMIFLLLFIPPGVILHDGSVEWFPPYSLVWWDTLFCDTGKVSAMLMLYS